MFIDIFVLTKAILIAAAVIGWFFFVIALMGSLYDS